VKGQVEQIQAGLARHSIGAGPDDWAGLPVRRLWIRISQTVQAARRKCLAGRLSGRGDQFCAVLPSRSEIVEGSAEITALVDLASTLRCVSFGGLLLKRDWYSRSGTIRVMRMLASRNRQIRPIAVLS
jgi:hypothetical protein